MPNVNVPIEQQEIDRKGKLPDSITWGKIIKRGLSSYESQERRKKSNPNHT